MDDDFVELHRDYQYHSESVAKCKCTTTYESDDNVICIDCGKVVKTDVFEKPEMNQFHKKTTNHILTVILELGIKFPQKIVEEANIRYMKVVEKETQRNIENKIKNGEDVSSKKLKPSAPRKNRKKSLTVVCLSYAYKSIENKTITCSRLMHIFNSKLTPQTALKQKDISSVLMTYYEAFPEDKKIKIRAIDILPDMLQLLDIPIEYIDKISTMIRAIENNSIILSKCSPVSICASVIYLFLCINYKKLGDKRVDFHSKVKLSNITVLENAREAQKILFPNNVINGLTPKKRNL